MLSGLFGVGGGVVIVPGLTLGMGLAQHAAVATSLAAILIIAPAALIGYVLDGAVAYGAALTIAVGSVAGAFLGVPLSHRIPAVRLRQVFAVLLLVIAVRLALPSPDAEGTALALGVGSAAALVGLGLVAGVLSTLLGVGGGIVVVPALVVLFGVSPHLAEGTSLLVILPTALVGARGHGGRGVTDWHLGLLLGAGGVFGGLLGAQLALALPAVWLSRLFAVLLVAVAVRMLRQRPAPPGATAAGAVGVPRRPAP